MIKQEAIRDGVRAIFNCRNLHEVGVVREVWGEYPFYIPDSSFIIEKGWNVVDIGGHIGTFSVYAGLRGANVLTFEPVKATYEVLGMNIKENCLSNVRTVNAGAWYKKDKIELYTSKDATGSSSIKQNVWSDGSKELISLVDVNKYLNELEYIDFLKMDCEGSEYTIFEHLSEGNWNKIKRIVIETHLGYDMADRLFDDFKKRGFNCTLNRGDDGTCRGWCSR